MADEPGPVALVGSGEFLPAMEALDGALLEGRPRRAAFLPTAAAREGDARVAYWLELGTKHYEALGVEPVPVDVRTRADADDPAMASLVAGAGLVYLSGGDPHHLSSTLRGTLVWEAICSAWRGGAALAGCSAGAMALTAGAPADLVAGAGRAERPAAADGANGLGLVGRVAVIPHFDQLERWRPGALARFEAWRPPGTVLVGIDEETALVDDGGRWCARGAGAVWLLEAGGRTPFADGDAVPVEA